MVKKTETITVIVGKKFGIGGRIISYLPLICETIPEGMIIVELPLKEAERFTKNNGHKKYKVIDGVAVYDETLPDYRGILELENELSAIQVEMNANDYKQLKYIRGRMSEEEWQDVVLWYDEKTILCKELKNQIEALKEEES
jgi:hypothetical protein